MPTHRLGPRMRRTRAFASFLLLTCLLLLSAACGEAGTPIAAHEPASVATVLSSTPAAAPSVTTAGLAVADPTGTVPTRLSSPTPPPGGTGAPVSVTRSPSATATATVTATPMRSTTPPPSPTATPTATPSSTLPVYDAVYVADVTIPDGTAIEPGTSYTKTWRLRNTGSAPWDEDTALVLAAGEAMGAPEAVPVPATAPGETADVSVPMVAPAATGAHSAAWRLCRGEDCFGGAVTLQIVSRPAVATADRAVELPIPAGDAEPSAPAEVGACNYVGNRNPASMKFHRADCRWVQEMREENKVCFETREEAIAAGYVACKVCKP